MKIMKQMDINPLSYQLIEISHSLLKLSQLVCNYHISRHKFCCGGWMWFARTLLLGLVIAQRLIMSGDVELNPGPLDSECEQILSKVDDITFEEDDWNIVIDECSSLNSKWEEISGYLGLRHSLIDSIKQDNQNNSSGCLNEAFKQWIMQNYSTEKFNKPSWRTLLTAVAKVDKLLFKQLSEKHWAQVDLHPVVREKESTISTAVNDNADVTETKYASADMTVMQPSAKPCNFATLHKHPNELSKEEKELLHTRLYTESEDMMYKFQQLFSATLKSLKERKFPVAEFTSHVELLGSIKPTYRDSSLPPLRHRLPGLANASTVDAAMSIVKDYCSFFNYRLLEHIINELGTEQDKLNLTKYKEDFVKYGERHVFECPSEVGKMNENGHTNMIVTLDDSFDNCTVNHLQSFISNLRKTMKISSEVELRLCRIESGSVKLIFQLPCFVLQDKFPLSSDQEANLAALGVIQLSCGDYRFLLVEDKELKTEAPTTQDDGYSESVDSNNTCGTELASEDKPQDVSSTTTDSGLITTCTSEKETQFSDESERDFDVKSLKTRQDEAAGIIEFELHFASLEGNLDYVKQLTEEKHLHPQRNDRYGLNALHYAAIGGHMNVLNYFVEEQGHNPSCFSHEGWTPLHIAARYGNFELVQYLINKQMVDPLCQNIAGSTPLHMACKCGDIEIIDYLIDRMSYYLPLKEVSSIQNNKGFTPLHHAVCYKHLNIVQYLVHKQKIDPLCQTKDGDTPLHLACAGGSIDIVKYLVNEMSQHRPLKDVINCRGNDGQAPIHMAVLNGHLEIVKYFTDELNCDPNITIQEAPGFNGRVPLHAAAQGGHLDIVKFLVEQKKCNASYFDENKITPLHMAAREGHLDIIEYLTLEQNCNPVLSLIPNDSTVNTPLHVAARCGHLDVIKFFVEILVCPLDIRGWHNMTPLEQARMKGHHHVVMYLEDISSVLTVL